MTQVTDNTAEGRFELVEDGLTAYADYRLDGDRLYIDYVFAPVPLRGKGTSERLMQGVVGEAKDRGLRITPICGYAAAWLKRSPEGKQLLA